MIAMDRYRIIARPFSAVSEGSGLKLRILIFISTWVVCSLISAVHFIQFTIVHEYEMIPSDICFIHLYDNKYSITLTLYVNLLYGLILPVLFLILTGIHIKMMYKLCESSKLPGKSDSPRNYGKMYCRFIIGCATYLICSMILASMTYLSKLWSYYRNKYH